MSCVSCDFWSPSANQIKDKLDHLSSYFLVFRRPVLTDEDFLSFWKRVGPQPDASAVIAKYERGLTRLLCEKGYRSGSSLPPTGMASFLKTDYVENYLLKYRSSWLKVRLMRDNPLRALNLGAALAKTDNFYPRELIDVHISRMIGSAWPAHYDYRYIGTYERGIGPFALKSKIKRNKKRLQARAWWKVNLEVFRVTIFTFVWPFKA